MLEAGSALGYLRGLCCIPLGFLGGCFCNLRFACVGWGGLQPGRGLSLFQAVVVVVGCLKLVGRRVCASRSEVSPAGKLQ